MLPNNENERVVVIKIFYVLKECRFLEYRKFYIR